MNNFKLIFLLTLILGLVFSACSAKIDVNANGQQGNEQGSNSLGVEITLGDSDSNSQSNNNQEVQGNDTSEAPQPLVLRPVGLLILLAIVLIILISLFLGLIRNKRREV